MRVTDTLFVPDTNADYLGILSERYKTELAKLTDMRLSYMQEIIMAIKLVKFYVWENSFEGEVMRVRVCLCDCVLVLLWMLSCSIYIAQLRGARARGASVFLVS